MEENIKEGYFIESSISISLEDSVKIINQMKNSMCKIYTKQKIGTGYLCKINYKSKIKPFLIINNHLLNKENLEKNKEKIAISIYDNKKKKNKEINIKINKGREKYTNEELNVTLIEIKPDLDKIELDKCLELDENLNENIIKNKSIYIFHYPKENNISVSYGLISEINGREIQHSCNIEYGSSCFPIISLKNLKVIGIHIGTKKDNQKNEIYNKGICMKYILLEMNKNNEKELYNNENIKKNKNNEIEIINIKKNKNNEMKIIYDNKENENKIKIFGYHFVKNNKKNCKLLIENKEEELCDQIKVKGKNKISIILKEIKPITNMSNMFYECSSLSSLPDFSKWNTSKVINMYGMFYKCSSLSSLPDISNWNISEVTDISFMFYECSSLTSLPDISNWNTSKVINMYDIFYKCSSLASLPDISKWNTSNVTSMNDMFSYCSSLSYLPEISKWDTSNVIDMNKMFSYCSSLSYLPDISKWNISKVTNMYGMFFYCSSLLSLPDISNWNISKDTDIRYMFFGCADTLNIPDKFII